MREKGAVKTDDELKKYREDMQRFTEQLTPQCLKVKEMEGDGNCLFRAVADQLEGDEELHSEYRLRTVEYIL